MNLDVLKDLFLIGNEDDVNAFVATLKPRCIQTSSYTVEENGVAEKLIFNSENDTYFDRFMHLFKYCDHCGTVHPADDFVTVEICKLQRIREEGHRNFRKTETVCRTRLESGEFVVPLHDFVDDTDVISAESGLPVYLYKDNPDTRIIHLADGRTVYNDVTYSNVINVRQLYTWDYVNDQRGDSIGTDHEFWEVGDHITEVHNTNRRCYSNWLLTSEVDAHPETWIRCSDCGEYYHAGLLTDGVCDNCNKMEIFGYHRWNGVLEFKHSAEETVNDNTMYFGVEIETCGNSDNAKFVKPIKDVFHLETDGSLPYGGFEMISQPMTWQFVRDNKDRFADVFEALMNAGQKSHDNPKCGLHIHVSYKAFNGMKAVKRAVAIVNRFRTNMVQYSRRESTQYAAYHNIPENFTESDLAFMNGTRYLAVNLENIGRSKNTVEFRVFRGTLNIETFLAAIELVKNIVEFANSNVSTVTFGDLLHGEYVPSYVATREKRGISFDRNIAVSFWLAEMSFIFDDIRNHPETATDNLTLLNNMISNHLSTAGAATAALAS